MNLLSTASSPLEKLIRIFLLPSLTSALLPAHLLHNTSTIVKPIRPVGEAPTGGAEQWEKQKPGGMYVTRPLSLYRASPSAASEPPPEGPHSGLLVVQDKEFEAQATGCCGIPYLSDLPFPQNRLLTVEYTNPHAFAPSTYDVFFFPVPGQPLSSNRYYLVRAKGKRAGKVCTCTREEDKQACGSCFCVSDVKPRPFDHGDVYQQVEVVPYRGSGGGFYARAVAANGFPPRFLWRKEWKLFTSRPRSLRLDLGEASGVDAALRARMPDTNFPMSSPRSPAVIVGKWYCPFIFVKEEGCPLKEQMKRSVFYEVALEQFWEAIHTCEIPPEEMGRAVQVSADVRRESAQLRGCEPVKEELPVEEGVVWFRPAKAGEGGVGLSAAVVEGMRWEEERGGWAAGEGVVERVEEYRGGGWGWREFGCYVLVERFAVRRIDGSLVLASDFRHVDKITTRWE